ncbi:MAG: hypothetical protein COU08_00650 [Candidatus Harrisonbacteria bacterium CG10_big_fil_rev_8_21_14_0_10_42_17]|uniref:Uncharacterized protein n=1 Tax=Candidatus Harrisonbacteria bacterium CG10_big_fil_rev_8_21_14_0_10_42_17 TaxID=1974584 RepID=A0A2M6WJ00_9BACT|nr:MAG: hypothetical protein COU08_00650 [Candidatus Harrisonbacteria bacterium CG10_big_fil_rev_8_21_14_0_10_42_17]
MYSPRIDENQIQRLYRLREFLKADGQKATMIGMVREAVESYLNENETRKKNDAKAETQLDKTGQ